METVSNYRITNDEMIIRNVMLTDRYIENKIANEIQQMRIYEIAIYTDCFSLEVK